MKKEERLVDKIDKTEREEFYNFVDRKYKGKDAEKYNDLPMSEIIALFRKEKAAEKREKMGTLAAAVSGGRPKVLYQSNGTMPKEIAAHYNDFILREGLNKIFDEIQAAKQSGKELTDEKKKSMHNERVVSKLKKMSEHKAVRFDERVQ